MLAILPFGPLVAAAQSDEDAGFVPVTDAMLEDPAPDDWLMWRSTQNGWGYGPLDQVNRDNVGDLQLVSEYRTLPGSEDTVPRLEARRGSTLSVDGPGSGVIRRHQPRAASPPQWWTTPDQNIDSFRVSTGRVDLYASRPSASMS